LAERGARVAASVADAVRDADRVHLVLLDDDTVDAVCDAARESLPRGAVMLDHTTTQPARTAARAARLAEEGIAYLHAPVMMGPPAARSAKGLMLAAGPQAAFNRVRDEVSRMTGELWYLGERADLAAVYKLVGNAMILGAVGLLGDIMHLVDAAGVPRSGALEMLNKVNVSGALAFRGAMMEQGNYPANFTMPVARKDVRLMLETIDTHGGATSGTLLRALASAMDVAIADGATAVDFAALGQAR
jgi:3-hydroxyisobutyrate dehydrogenase-like beta-hydroxyacid dehydrogenase